MYLTYREENRTLAQIGMWQPADTTLTVGGEPERVRALLVTHGILEALRIQPARGRSFTEAEHEAGAQEPDAILLSHAYWQRRFGGDETTVGREISIDVPGGPGTLRSTGLSQVVGVLSSGFRFLDMTPPLDVIVAKRLDPGRQAHGARLGDARPARTRRNACRGASGPGSYDADLA